MHDVTVETVLNAVLHEEGLDYYITGKTIFLTPLPPVKVDVKGKVVNEQNEALGEATIMIKNTAYGKIADEKGEFELRDVTEGTVLVITNTGYRTQEQMASGKFMKIVMVRSYNQLDESQVIAYGLTTQRLSTGNITVVEKDEIEKQPVDNPLLALEGRIPGCFITQADGLPGTGVKVRIQGQNSISNGNDPLYVIDGVPYFSQLAATTIGGPLGSSGGPVGATISGSPLSYINPDDIESISVLKDADATAIYGSRAANGVIYINTKRGRPGKTKATINLQQGWGKAARRLPVMNGQQYLQMRHEALANDGIAAPAPTDYDINGFWDTTRNTNWQQVLLGGTAQYSNINASVSGGTSLTQYLLAGTYHRVTTVFPGDFGDAKGSVHFNLNTTSADQRFSLHLTTGYLYDNDLLPQVDLTGQAITLAPDAPALFNPGGTLNWKQLPTGAATWSNPVAYLKRTYTNKAYNLMGNAVLGYTLLNGLTIQLSLGYTNLRTDEFSGNPLSAYPAGQPASSRSASYSINSSGSWIVEPNIGYHRLAGGGKLELLLGSTLEENNANGLLLGASGFNSDAQLPDIHSAAVVNVVRTVQTLYKYTGAFGRANYNWKEKYLINLTLRRDGSSRFGPANAFHDFWALGTGWIFSQEPFVRTLLPVLSFGKLRGSYGTTGNDQIGDYRYMSLYNTVNAGVPYQGTTGLAAANLANPNLQWEQTRKFEMGLDMGFWHDRVILTTNVVRNRTSSELLNENLPILTGFSSVSVNLPALVQNTEVEFELNTIIIREKGLSWSAGLNLTLPHNELLHYAGALPANLVLKKPLGISKLFHFAGVDQATGGYDFLDSHGHLVDTPKALTDNTALRNTVFPAIYGGLENVIRYKGFELSFVLQFVKATGAVDDLGQPPGPGYRFINQPVYVVSRWQRPGEATTVQRYNSDPSLNPAYSFAQQSTAAYGDASYIRFKNLSLAYTASPKLAHLLHSQSLRLFVHGENLLTFTHFHGLDPETGVAVLPPLRMVTVGLQLEL